MECGQDEVDPDVPVYDLSDCTFSSNYGNDQRGMKSAVWLQGGEVLWDEFKHVRQMYKDRFSAEGYLTGMAARRAWLMAYADIMGESWECLNWRGSDVDQLVQPGVTRQKKRIDASQGFVDDRIQYLAGVAKDRRGSQAGIRAWAFANLATPWMDIEDAGVPHPGAPAFLRWLKTEKGQGIFFTELTKAGRASLEETQSDEEVRDETLGHLTDLLQEKGDG